MIWTVFGGCFLCRIGGATTFASAKVKDAIGRIGIFDLDFATSPEFPNSCFSIRGRPLIIWGGAWCKTKKIHLIR